MKILLCFILGLSAALAARNYTNLMRNGVEHPDQVLLFVVKRYSTAYTEPQRQVGRELFYNGQKDGITITQYFIDLFFYGEDNLTFESINGSSGLGNDFYDGEAGCQRCQYLEITFKIYGVKRNPWIPPPANSTMDMIDE